MCGTAGVRYDACPCQASRVRVALQEVLDIDMLHRPARHFHRVKGFGSRHSVFCFLYCLLAASFWNLVGDRAVPLGLLVCVRMWRLFPFLAILVVFLVMQVFTLFLACLLTLRLTLSFPLGLGVAVTKKSSELFAQSLDSSRSSTKRKFFTGTGSTRRAGARCSGLCCRLGSDTGSFQAMRSARIHGWCHQGVRPKPKSSQVMAVVHMLRFRQRQSEPSLGGQAHHPDHLPGEKGCWYQYRSCEATLFASTHFATTLLQHMRCEMALSAGKFTFTLLVGGWSSNCTARWLTQIGALGRASAPQRFRGTVKCFFRGDEIDPQQV